LVNVAVERLAPNPQMVAQEMTNIVPFPVARGNRDAAIEQRDTAPPYEFSQEELASLCRWYSAMKYAFPQLRGVMAVCHRQRASAVGLYGEWSGAELPHQQT